MRIYIFLPILFLLLVNGPPMAPMAPAGLKSPVRLTVAFDADWRFLKADAVGAEKPDFDDQGWRTLDVPHDWSIEGPFDQKHPTGGAGGFLPAGIGWYRKRFTLPANQAGRRHFIEFDGVMANSEVWINGHRLGKRPYGYVSFRYELTGHLRFGGPPNILAVRCDNSAQPASRWYTGAGIYRHVRLVVTDPVHLEHWGTFVSTPQVAARQAAVRVQSEVVNQSDSSRRVALEISILDPNGRTIRRVETAPQQIEAGRAALFQQELTIRNPRRWNLDSPSLYRAVVRVHDGPVAIDDETVTFGIREARFEAATGFWLNGRNFKIKGVNLHHDASAFGAAVPLPIWELRLEALRNLGVNAIRTAHNPPSPDFLDLCDRMGFLVMDELFDCWTVAKNPHDYHLYFKEWAKIDLRDTVRRDRNHPSVVIYSAGNEIHDTPKAELAKEILSSLVAAFHEADPTRPVTQGLFRPNVSHDYDNGLADLLDVVGQNYRENEILAAHRQNPQRKILGTENGHDRQVWLALRDNAPYAGQFIWSGIDYLGESRQWPAIADNFGLLDRTGLPRPSAYQRRSWWDDRPMVYMTRRVAPTAASPTDPGYEPIQQRRPQVLFADWTPRDLSPHEEQVEVYSNCNEVVLYLNGKRLGSKPRPADDSPRIWNVPFEPGTIQAFCSTRTQPEAAHELRTAGEPAKILLTTDRDQLRARWDDLTTVTALVVDKNGETVPTATNSIEFKVTGPGFVAAVDSGDNRSHESFQSNTRRAYQGRCLAFIRARASGGRLTVIASAAGLAPATVVIRTIE